MRLSRRNVMTISLAGEGEAVTRENMRLRLESDNGSATHEYRIDNGIVEVRSLRSAIECEAHSSDWRRVTRQQLRNHVERNTVVAQWLERRLGWRRLLQACVSHEPADWQTAEEHEDRRAA